MNEAPIQQYLELMKNLLHCADDEKDQILQAHQELLDENYLPILRKDQPKLWATLQNLLGIAYKNRIKGDRGENIEKAIAAFESALSVITRTDSPEIWADTQTRLGNAYLDYIKGDIGENIEKAIQCYDHALEIYTSESYPIKGNIKVIKNGLMKCPRF